MTMDPGVWLIWTVGPTLTQDLFELADRSHALKWRISSLARYLINLAFHSLPHVEGRLHIPLPTSH